MRICCRAHTGILTTSCSLYADALTHCPLSNIKYPLFLMTGWEDDWVLFKRLRRWDLTQCTWLCDVSRDISVIHPPFITLPAELGLCMKMCFLISWVNMVYLWNLVLAKKQFEPERATENLRLSTCITTARSTHNTCWYLPHTKRIIIILA